ncbi:MAG: hypothetical protein BWY74_00353 [Firmicutes bacterium ADurb.Bin419]|nr:MAG: hypothetical protein BWY74_00353 [Firmicutes bacterium ADurb.Bin419]
MLTDTQIMLCKDALKAFQQSHPEIWIDFCESIKAERRQLFDPEYGRGRDKRGGQRFRATFPSDYKGNSILDMFIHYVPDLLKNKRKFNHFLEEFPEFKIAQKG